jgi:hypothetical protein
VLTERVGKAGMVFAMETCRPSADGASAARTGEEAAVTGYGTEILARSPAAGLPIAAAC